MARRRKVEVKRGRGGKWYWHTVSANGSDIVKDGGQGYVRKGYCIRRAAEENGVSTVIVFDDENPDGHKVTVDI